MFQILKAKPSTPMPTQEPMIVVRTVTPTEDASQNHNINILRMIVEMVPDKIKQLNAEREKLETRIAELNAEAEYLEKVLAPAKEFYTLSVVK
jgi:hypothetical protein